MQNTLAWLQLETLVIFGELLVLAGARFTNVILPAIQIRWKIRLAIIPLLAIRSQQIVAHATTTQLSCYVQIL